MPRRGNIAKRDVLADPIYNSKMVTRLVNSVMLDGKKGVAQKIVYEAFSMIQEKTGNDPLETFEKAMENIMPSLECKTRRVGGANYQVPLEVSPARRETLGLRWLTACRRSSRCRRTRSAQLRGFCPVQTCCGRGRPRSTNRISCCGKMIMPSLLANIRIQ